MQLYCAISFSYRNVRSSITGFQKNSPAAPDLGLRPSGPLRGPRHGCEAPMSEGDQFGGIYIDEASNDLLVDSPAGGTTIIDGVSIVSELNKLVSAVLLQRRHLNGGAPRGLPHAGCSTERVAVFIF